MAGGFAAAADPVAPAPGYPQAVVYEPVFVSSSKPLPVVPPAVLTQPVVAPRPAATVAAPVAHMQPVVPVQVGAPPVGPAPPRPVEEDLKQYQVLLEPPSATLVFDVCNSEKDLEKRMRQQAMQRKPPSDVQFPDREPISTSSWQARSMPASRILSEPNFVCHDRLYCEEKNAERYGWDLGVIQPFVSTLYFARDTLIIPLAFVGRPLRHALTPAAGKCLPGDPVPYILYPLEPGPHHEGRHRWDLSRRSRERCGCS